MLLDPRNLGLDGFVLGEPPEETTEVDLSELSPNDAKEGAVLKKRISLEPGYARIRAEGPAVGSFRLLLDGVEAKPADMGLFILPPTFSESALLTIKFSGHPAPLTGLWLLP